ncbi:hypothetical protein ACI3PL_32575, partial [Lacticaseibacillus paracasei]
MEVFNVMPSLANRYASTSIVEIMLIFFVIASLHHVVPYHIKWTIPKSMFSEFFPIFASATLRG